jgi:hypothetical protein
VLDDYQSQLQNIQQTITAFLQSNWITIVVTIIGLLASYILYRRQIYKKQPMWGIRNNVLIGSSVSKLSGLSIQYNNRPVSNLSVSLVMVWNNGDVVIDERDLDTEDRLRIQCSPKDVGSTAQEVEILDVKTVAKNGKSRKMELMLGTVKDHATIEFDYLAKRQGAVFQVVHTGSSVEDIKVVGELRDGNPLKRIDVHTHRYLYLPTPREFDEKLSLKTVRRLNMISLALVLLLVIGGTGFIATTIIREGDMGSIPAVIVGIFLVVTHASRAWNAWRRSIPEGLEVFAESM